MDYPGLILGIALIHFLAISSPGPTFFVVLGHAGSGDWRGSVFVVIGVVLATIVWSTLAATGLGAAMNAVPGLPDMIRILGGAYLTWFGYKMLRSAWTGGGGAIPEQAAGRTAPLAALRSGFITNISNPKVIAYYLSLFGVMVPPNSPPTTFAVACLTAIFVSILWWGAVSAFFRLPLIRRGFLRVRRVLDGIVGAALVGFGIKLIVIR